MTAPSRVCVKKQAAIRGKETERNLGTTNFGWKLCLEIADWTNAGVRGCFIAGRASETSGLG